MVNLINFNHKNVIILLLILIFFSCKGNHNCLVCEENISSVFIDKSIRLHELLRENKIDEGLLLTDSLINNYPDEPSLYFILGWIWDKKENEELKRVNFLKCRNLYDKRLIERNNINDAINRACVTQILYGKDAYKNELDSLRNLHILEYDMVLPNPLWDYFDYEEQKDQLFNRNVRRIDN